MLTSIIISLLALGFSVGYALYYNNKKIKNINNKTNVLYHDINGSLVIAKLIMESLRDFSLNQDVRENQHIKKLDLSLLINNLDEAISQINKSFDHWNIT